MRFEVTFTAADLRETRQIAAREVVDPEQRRRAKNGPVGWTMAVLIVVSVYFGVRSTGGPPGSQPPSSSMNHLLTVLAPYLVGFVLGLVAVAGVAFFKLNARGQGRNSLLDRTVAFDVTDAGVATTEGPVQMVRQWTAFDRVAESNNLFALRVKAGGYWIALPKRYLTDLAEFAAVRRLFEAVAVPPPPSTGGSPVVPIDG